MVPNTPHDDSNPPRTQAGHAPQAGPESVSVSVLEDRQPPLSEPILRSESPGTEPAYDLVPDTRDDIVVSRIE